MSRYFKSAKKDIQNASKLMQKGKHKEALEFVQKAEKTAMHIRSDDILLRVLTIKGKLKQETGEYEEALKINLLNLKDTQELVSTYPNNKRFERIFQTNFSDLSYLGNICNDTGYFFVAEKCFVEIIAICQKFFEIDPKEIYQFKIALAFNNLGNSLSGMGRFEEAKQKYEDASEIYEKLLYTYADNGKYQFNLATTLSNIGNVFFKMGSFEESEQKLIKSVETYKKLFQIETENAEHQLEFGGTLVNLGNTFYIMGRFEEAKKMYEEANEIYEKLLYTDTENEKYQLYLAKKLNNLGALFYESGSSEEAKETLEKALKIREKISTKNPKNSVYLSELGSTLNNLGILLFKMGYFKESEQKLIKALEIREKLQKETENEECQSDVAAAMNNLGAMFTEMGRIEEAKQKYEKALEIYEKLLKTDTKNVIHQSNLAMALNNLGVTLTEMDNIEEAKQKYEKALQILTEPMQYLTIGRKSNSIIRLIQLCKKQAETETNDFRKLKYLEEAYKLCISSQVFLSKYELKYEKKLVMEVGLSAYLDYVITNIKGERKAEKRVKGYERAIKVIEKLRISEKNEDIEKIASSASYYLEGKKLINEALGSEEPDLELIKQATNLFDNAKQSYKKANVCYCIYVGLLNILEDVEIFEDNNGLKAKNMINHIIEILPEETDQNLRTSFEEVIKIFDEVDIKGRKRHLKEFDTKIREIESLALENIFGHVLKKLKDYIEGPFIPTLIYDNWKLKITFDDPEKINGKLTIKIGNKTLLNRVLTAEEVKSNLLEINYLDKKYFPQGEDEIIFTIPGQRTVTRTISYFENFLNEKNKIRILLHDCSENLDIGQDLRIASIQLKYHICVEDFVVKLVADEAYHRKVMTILKSLNGKSDIVVFPEFSIPFDYLEEIKQYSEDTGIIIVAGSHYVIEENIGKYGHIFNRNFREEDLRKNICPVVIPSSKIVHIEKLIGAREERELFFSEGMEAGEINNIFKIRDDLQIGIMICYEYLNSNFRNHLIPACDIILVPQANMNPERFYKTAKHDINNPLCSGNRAYIMANGMFTVGDSIKVIGGSTGIVSTLDKYSYERLEEGIIKPIDGIMEQFILVMAINTRFNPARDTQVGQVPIITKIIHIFEENEALSRSETEGRTFIQLLKTIENCRNKDEIKKILNSEINRKVINTFSPLMQKHTQDLKELNVYKIKEKYSSLLIN